MPTPLTTNAYNELRKAGFFSGTNQEDDQVVGLVTTFCKAADHLNISPDDRDRALVLLDDLAFGRPVSLK